MQTNAEKPSVNGRQEHYFVRLSKVTTNRVLPPVYLNPQERHDLSVSDLNVSGISLERKPSAPAIPFDPRERRKSPLPVAVPFDKRESSKDKDNVDLNGFFENQKKDQLIKEMTDKADMFIGEKTKTSLVMEAQGYSVDEFKEFVAYMIVQASVGEGKGLTLKFCKDTFTQWQLQELEKGRTPRPQENELQDNHENKNPNVLEDKDKAIIPWKPSPLFYAGTTTALLGASLIGVYKMGQDSVEPIIIQTTVEKTVEKVVYSGINVIDVAAVVLGFAVGGPIATSVPLINLYGRTYPEEKCNIM